MKLNARISAAINEFSMALKDAYGDKLAEVLLFGSYSRGEATIDSDVDVMVILDMSESEARKNYLI